MSFTARTQLLMDPSELAELKKLAKRRRTSVGRLIRDAVREKYLADDQDARRAAFERIMAMDIGPMPDWDELKKELDDRYDCALRRRERRALRRRRGAPAS